MADATTLSERGTPPARPARRRFGWAWLGPRPVLPLLDRLHVPAGGVTWSSAASSAATARPPSATTPTCRRASSPDAFGNSIEISLVTAIAGGIFGFLLAYAVILGGLPRFLRTALMTFSGVASNFAGVPLALAFIFTLGIRASSRSSRGARDRHLRRDRLQPDARSSASRSSTCTSSSRSWS